MSFGGGTDYNRGINNLGGLSAQATNQLFPAAFNSGTSAINQGQSILGQGVNTVTPATNFFNTILNGNRQNTTAMLQPDINRVREAQQANLQAASTLMPRGGGRSGTLFSLPFQANSQIQSLYNPLRSQAATGLAGIGGQLAQLGLGEGGLGANLFGIGNQALGTAAGASGNLAGLGLQQKQMSNSLAAGLGGGLFNLATMPLGGSLLGGLAGIK